MSTPARPSQLPELWMELIDRKRLAKLMAIQEVSPRKLALAVGWKSKTSVVRLLDGSAKFVDDAERAVRIARFLGVGTDDLFVARMSSAADDNLQAKAS